MKLALIFLAGCIAQVQNAVAPPPPSEATGALTCSEIVTRCDAACGDPLCIQSCTQQGNPSGAQLHANVVACAQQNACTDEACIHEKCSAEANACEADAPASPPNG